MTSCPTCGRPGYCPACGRTSRPPASVRPGSGHPNWCRCQGCRRDVAQFESGLMKFDRAAVAALFAIVGIVWIALAPFRIWHKIGTDGNPHPDAATFIAYGVSGGVLFLLLMVFSIRAANRRAASAPVPMPASVAEAWEAVDESDRGGPRKDLRSAANEEGMIP